MTTLANAWVVEGISVTLITLSNVDTDVYLLDSRVKAAENKFITSHSSAACF